MLRAITKLPEIRDRSVRQIVGNAVCQMILLRIIAQIGERQHDNRQTPICNALRRRKDAGNSIRVAPCHRCNKLIAAPDDRADASTLSSALIEDTAKRRDLDCQIAFFDDRVRPDGGNDVVL